jgi:RNA polymerase sigma-70 factor (ECF subfamily)
MGDAGRMRELYAQYGDQLREWVTSRLPEHPDRVDDVCQEVWAAVPAALPRFRDEAQPRTWLFAIAKHKIYDVLRSRARHPRVSLDEVVTPIVISISQQQSHQIQKREVARVTADVLAQLTPEERDLLKWRYIDGLAPRQIFEQKGIGASPNAVSQRLVAVQRKLRKLIAERGLSVPARRRKL